MSDERQEMLKAAIAGLLKNKMAVSVKNVRRHGGLPDDFFVDFDSGQPLDSNIVFAEIKAAEAALPRMPPMIAKAPTGADLPDVIDDSELLGEEPSDDLPETAMPVIEAAPSATDDDVSDGGNVRPLSPQARLDAAHDRERELVGAIPLLRAKEADARAALAKAIREFHEADPTRETPEQLRWNFIAQSNAERAARARGESWATRPARERRGHIAPIDAERIYSQGGDANSFARRMAQTGSTRGAFTKREAAMRGFVNHDPTRGPVLAPLAEPKPTVPMLANK